MLNLMHRLGFCVLSCAALSACTEAEASSAQLVTITGHAADLSTGEGIAGLRVKLRVGGIERTAITTSARGDDVESAGDFRFAPIALPAGTRDIAIETIDEERAGHRSFWPQTVTQPVANGAVHVELALSRDDQQPGS